MAGGFHIFYEAAEALWNMPNNRLEEMARDDGAPANRRAAMAALRIKAEYVSPELFGNERSSISKLAGTLNDDPGFTMEMALRMGTPARRRSRKAVVQAGIVLPSGRSRVMWLSITAGVILLLMDVLATAGIPIPTPIGTVIDKFAGADESPVSPPPPAPPPPRRKGTRGSIMGDGGELYALPLSRPRAATDLGLDNAPPRRITDEIPAAHPNGSAPEPARGSELHQAGGRELHQAQGRELHQAQGRELHQPFNRGNSKTKSPPGPNARSNGKGPSGK